MADVGSAVGRGLPARAQLHHGPAAAAAGVKRAEDNPRRRRKRGEEPSGVGPGRGVAASRGSREGEKRLGTAGPQRPLPCIRCA
jgi:hypothetical protein